VGASEAMRTMPWIAWLDLDTEVSDDGLVRTTLRRPKPEHLNHNGHINAAVAYGVAEVAGAGAAVAAAGDEGTGAYTVIRTGTIEYRRPASGGITAQASVAPETAAQVRQQLRLGAGCDVEVAVALEDPAGGPVGRCGFVVSFRRRDRVTGS
jgi:acyl-coenzyme A thioesterase PaaI-like protein